MRLRIASVVLALGLALTSAPAFAKGGYHPNKQKKRIPALGSASRTGNKDGNAEKAEPEAKIVDEPDGPSYGNEVVDPPIETAKPKAKAKPKAPKS